MFHSSETFVLLLLLNNMSLIPIEGRDGFFRDSKTKAIINKNANDYNTYIANRQKLSSDQQRISNLESEIDQMKGDLSDIKMLLQHLVEKHK